MNTTIDYSNLLTPAIIILALCLFCIVFLIITVKRNNKLISKYPSAVKRSKVLDLILTPDELEK